MNEFIEWEDWIPFKEARDSWDNIVAQLTEEEIEDLGPFNTSSHYLEARLAYRRYVNNCPDSETT